MTFLKLINISSKIKFEQILVFEETTVAYEDVLFDAVTAKDEQRRRCLLLLLVRQLHRVVQSKAFT
jgi:hypothetical protein